MKALPSSEIVSWASSDTARKVMQGNRSRDTKPELAVRRLLHRAGLRYRVAYRPVAGVRRTADIVFTRQRLAVFIDGCYWHGCPAHGQSSTKANSSYWETKFETNRQRDVETTEILSNRGWRVMRFWEHEDPCEVADLIASALKDIGSSDTVSPTSPTSSA